MDSRKTVAQELLFQGCRELNYEMVVSAIKEGADVNSMAPYKYPDRCIYAADNPQYSPLSLVAMSGKISIPHDSKTDRSAAEIAALLLNHGAKMDILGVGDIGYSPLHWAIVTFKTDLCKYLIQEAIITNNNVINLNNHPAETKDDIKNLPGSSSPLLLALKAFSIYQAWSAYGNEIPELLIAAGVEINAVDQYDQSAFHLAAIMRMPISFFNLLIDKGAVYSKNAFGKTPKQLYENELNCDLIGSSKYYSYSSSECLVSDGTARDFVVEKFRRDAYNSQVVELLNQFEQSYKDNIQQIADSRPVNEQDHMGRTALHQAVFYGDVERIKKLLERDCDTTIKDNNGLTAQELSQYLIDKLTYKVSPKFFDGEEKTISPAQCVKWKLAGELIIQKIKPLKLI